MVSGNSNSIFVEILTYSKPARNQSLYHYQLLTEVRAVLILVTSRLVSRLRFLIGFKPLLIFYTVPASLLNLQSNSRGSSPVDISMSLSPELIDIIIDNLHNDKRSLTSKQWVTSCRFHLFSKMTVTPHRIPSLLHFLESHPTT